MFRRLEITRTSNKISLNEMKKGNKFLKKNMVLKKNNYILLISRTDRYCFNRKLFQSKDDLKNHEKSLGQSYRNSNFKDLKNDDFCLKFS